MIIILQVKLLNNHIATNISRNKRQQWWDDKHVVNYYTDCFNNEAAVLNFNDSERLNPTVSTNRANNNLLNSNIIIYSRLPIHWIITDEKYTYLLIPKNKTPIWMEATTTTKIRGLPIKISFHSSRICLWLLYTPKEKL